VLAERGPSRRRTGRCDPPQRSCSFSALADGGTYAFCTWFGNLLSNVAGQHQATIPDGQLYGPGASFEAFNAVSPDWPTTSLQSGQTITFQYAEKAAHPGSWTQYITKDGWDPNKPLAWGDLVQFDRVVNPPLTQDGVDGDADDKSDHDPHDDADRRPDGDAGRLVQGHVHHGEQLGQRVPGRGDHREQLLGGGVPVGAEVDVHEG
jgi:predicted carbohydrate-binding protein with CBM5 and CBM33 domain